MVELPFPADKFSTSLLDWYGQQGRSLPWRDTRDPYRIWLSEIMLQQTTVAAVIDYYQRFLQAFPTLDSLAAATQEDVIHLWAGLGYYSRARNLHRAAQLIATDYAGHFPEDVDSLQQLPGVGRSTAGAIAALAFERRAAILDGNVRRVLCRLCALQQPPRSTASEKQLWWWSEQLTPAKRVHDYTQAIMDLGATVCVPRQPLCEQCPVASICQARQLGLQHELPLKQVKKKVPVRKQIALMVGKDGYFLVRRRPSEGFLGGLWEFPNIGLAEDENAAQKLNQLLQYYAIQAEPALLGQIKHVYSHFRLELFLYRVEVEGLLVAEGPDCWYNYDELNGLALHGAHKKALKVLKKVGE